MDARRTFQHTALEDPTSQIRLLAFLNGPIDQVNEVKEAAETRIALSSWDLQQATQYAALSYTWGDPRDTAWIRIGDDTQLSATRNCAYALSQLRQQSYQYFWIDSVCIDQTNVSERSAQVNIMDQIFAQADCVFTSLGPFVNDFESATLAFAMTLPYGFELDVMTCAWVKSLGPSILSGTIDSVIGIAEREYWNRAWIVQEFAQAREVFILVGDACLPWANLLQFVNCLSALSWPPETQESLQNSPLNSTAKFRRKPGRRTEMHSDVKIPLADILKMVRERLCTDPRDRIYSILSMVRWENRLPAVRADYSKSYLQVAMQLITSLGPEPEMDVVRRLFEGHLSATNFQESSVHFNKEYLRVMTMLFNDCDIAPIPGSKNQADLVNVRLLPRVRGRIPYKIAYDFESSTVQIILGSCFLEDGDLLKTTEHSLRDIIREPLEKRDIVLIVSSRQPGSAGGTVKAARMKMILLRLNLDSVMGTTYRFVAARTFPTAYIHPAPWAERWNSLNVRVDHSEGAFHVELGTRKPYNELDFQPLAFHCGRDMWAASRLAQGIEGVGLEAKPEYQHSFAIFIGDDVTGVNDIKSKLMQDARTNKTHAIFQRTIKSVWGRRRGTGGTQM